MRVLAVIATLIACATPAQAQQQDWVSTVARTPEGGMRMGNPDAPVKLINYCSRSGPVCAAFFAASGDLRTKYVTSGKVSFEYRDFLIHPQDAAATLLGRCVPDDQFFPVLDQMYRESGTMFEKMAAITPARFMEIANKSRLGQARAFADDLGYTAMMKLNGLSDARIDRCLGDRGALAMLDKREQEGGAHGVDGTPTFFINGLKVEVISWSQLEPLLQAAGA